jgi:RNA polymerase sigma-70 factor (ECF subfamily)
VNQALERYRNNARTVFADKLNDIEHHSIPDEEDNKWEAYQLSEADLLAMIDTLPQQYKAVFNLYAIDGLSHREISGLLGISEGTSRSNLLRARSILQKQINEQVDLLSYKKKCK